MEGAIKRAVQKAKSKGINNFRFSCFYFDYLIPEFKSSGVVNERYMPIMDKMKEMGFALSNDACIWRVDF